MARSVYLTSPDGFTGKSVVALGLVDLLNRRVSKVGVFRPFVASHDSDPILQRLLEHAESELTDELPLSAHMGVTFAEVLEDPDAAMSTVVQRFHALAPHYDALVVLGSDYVTDTPDEFHLNAKVAANLGTPIFLTVSAFERSVEETSAAVRAAVAATRNQHATLGALVLNRAQEENRTALDTLADELSDSLAIPTWVLPEIPLLSAPTVAEVCAAVDGELIMGEEELLERECEHLLVCGMSVAAVLERLRDGQVVIAAVDREELIIALQAAHASEALPALAGIILNGTDEPKQIALDLVAGMGMPLPVMRTPYDTFDVASRAQLFGRGVRLDTPRKTTVALATIEKEIVADEVFSALDVQRPSIVTPLMFQSDLLEKARSNKQRIVLPEPDDDRILQAASILLAREVAEVILLGDESAVRTRATELGYDISGARVISPSDKQYLDKYAVEFARLRAHKGVTEDEARETLQDVSYFGTMMVHMDDADGMVSGAAHTTAHTIVPSFQIIKTKPGTKIVSSVFLMLLEDRVLVYGDCAVNPDPSAEELADIAISSAETAAQFGVEPRVAMLSYSTGTSGSGADVDKVREATTLAQERRPDLLIEGPIQYDAAIDPTVAAKKLPDSQVAGRATVFVFPDLNAGNNTYKAVQRSSGAVAVGPVLQGLNKPVNDLSRGALVTDIVNTVAITAIQSQNRQS